MLFLHASADMLSQHTVTQLQAREGRHAIPACKCRQGIPACSQPFTGQGMCSADKLSQHAVNQSQAREARQANLACIVQTSYPSMYCERYTV